MTAPVLYVEDEENDAWFMARAFRQTGISNPLQCVTDGAKAIAYLGGEAPYQDRAAYPLPCAVLLDLNLGFISGFEVLEWLRAQAQFQDLPVIIFSSSNNPQDREKALHLGANEFISKPASSVQFSRVATEFHERWLAHRAARAAQTSGIKPRDSWTL